MVVVLKTVVIGEVPIIRWYHGDGNVGRVLKCNGENDAIVILETVIVMEMVVVLLVLTAELSLAVVCVAAIKLMVVVEAMKAVIKVLAKGVMTTVLNIKQRPGAVMMMI